MNIAVIGVGNVGTALAEVSVRAGHSVTIASSDQAETEATARTAGARAAPRARVIKAINTVFAARQAEAALGGEQADGYVAGDDLEAKRRVLEFVESIGLRPFDVEPLAAARTLEGMGWLHISLAMEHDWSWQSAWKLVGPTAQ